MGTRKVHAEHDVVLRDSYAVEALDMKRLYENAKRDQWDANKDIDWTAGNDFEQGILPDEVLDIYGTELWNRLTAKERVRLNVLYSGWRLSQTVYGEQTATILSSQLVEVMEGGDYKLYATTQAIDEARHVEFFWRYVADRIGKHARVYPALEGRSELFDRALSDSRWYVKMIAMQLMIETVATAFFRMVADQAKDPVLRNAASLTHRDETRHMAFGVLSLPAVVKTFGPKEVEGVEDFVLFAAGAALVKTFPREVYVDFGFNKQQIQQLEENHTKQVHSGQHRFYGTLHGGPAILSDLLANNMERVGLLTPKVRAGLEGIGIDVAGHLAKKEVWREYFASGGLAVS